MCILHFHPGFSLSNGSHDLGLLSSSTPFSSNLFGSNERDFLHGFVITFQTQHTIEVVLGLILLEELVGLYPTESVY